PRLGPRAKTKPIPATRTKRSQPTTHDRTEPKRRAEPRPRSDGDTTMDMDKLVSLCKRRGIIFPSSEIYGGINGFWDYGPLGVELKRNVKEAWWRDIVTS